MLRDSRAVLNDLSAKTLRDSRGAPNDLLDVKISIFPLLPLTPPANPTTFYSCICTFESLFEFVSKLIFVFEFTSTFALLLEIMNF